MSTRRSRGFLLQMKQLVSRDFRTPIAGVYLTAQHPSHSHSPSGSVMRCRCPSAIQQRFLSLDPWARESLRNRRSLTAGDRSSLALWFVGLNRPAQSLYPARTSPWQTPSRGASRSVPSHEVFTFISRSKRLNLFLDIPTHKPPGMPSERLYVALKSF